MINAYSYLHRASCTTFTQRMYRSWNEQFLNNLQFCCYTGQDRQVPKTESLVQFLKAIWKSPGKSKIINQQKWYNWSSMKNSFILMWLVKTVLWHIKLSKLLKMSCAKLTGFKYQNISYSNWAVTTTSVTLIPERPVCTLDVSRSDFFAPGIHGG